MGASSGNEIVVRARGVYGRHVRLFERDGGYHLDLFKGIETVQVNGRDFFGGQITVGDRITIGEATITVVEASTAARAAAAAAAEASSMESRRPLRRRGALRSRLRLRACRSPRSSTADFAALGVSALPRRGDTAEDLATELTDFLDRELPPSEWAVGEFSPSSGFRPLASTFREKPAVPPRMVQDLRSGERLARAETRHAAS